LGSTVHCSVREKTEPSCPPRCNATNIKEKPRNVGSASQPTERKQRHVVLTEKKTVAKSAVYEDVVIPKVRVAPGVREENDGYLLSTVRSKYIQRTNTNRGSRKREGKWKRDGK